MWLQITILFLAIPVGYLIAWSSKDELLVGRKWFFIISIASFILAIFFLYLKNNSIAFALFYLAIIALVSYKKSFDKKWAKKSRI